MNFILAIARFFGFAERTADHVFSDVVRVKEKAVADLGEIAERERNRANGAIASIKAAEERLGVATGNAGRADNLAAQFRNQLAA